MVNKLKEQHKLLDYKNYVNKLILIIRSKIVKE